MAVRVYMPLTVFSTAAEWAPTPSERGGTKWTLHLEVRGQPRASPGAGGGAPHGASVPRGASPGAAARRWAEVTLFLQEMLGTERRFSGQGIVSTCSRQCRSPVLILTPPHPTSPAAPPPFTCSPPHPRPLRPPWNTVNLAHARGRRHTPHRPSPLVGGAALDPLLLLWLCC
jgi:hypothetical protein